MHSFLKAYPAKEADLKQFALLYYPSENKLTFPDKALLKKAVPLRPLSLFFRVAAVFILLIGQAYVFLFPTKNSPVFTERSTKINFPIYKEKPLQITINDKKPSLPVKNIPLAVPPKEVSNTNPTNGIAVEIDNQNNASTTENKEVEGISVASIENTKAYEELITSNEIVSSPSSSSTEEMQSQNILKFKRPRFKKKNEEDELLVSNDDQTETLIRIGNPIKGKRERKFLWVQSQ
jgi:hypothetical protein